MKRCFYHITTSICCLFFSTSLMGQVNISMDLDSSVIFIGDHLGLTVNIAAPKDTEIKNINYGNWADAGKVEILDLGALNTIAEDPELLLQQRLVFTTFDSGYHRLPPLEVIYELNGIPDTAHTGNLGLEVVSIPVREEADIMDNKDIIKEPINWVDFLPFIVAFLVVMILIGVIWRLSASSKRKPKVSAPPPPPVPAHVIALEKLAALEEQATWRTGSIKAYQSDLTYVLREYLENRFNLPALEATSPEIIKALQQRQLDTDGQLRTVLETADLVKFAKASPAEEVHQRSLTQVRDFVESTKKVVTEQSVTDTPATNDANEEEE